WLGTAGRCGASPAWIPPEAEATYLLTAVVEASKLLGRGLKETLDVLKVLVRALAGRLAMLMDPPGAMFVMSPSALRAERSIFEDVRLAKPSSGHAPIPFAEFERRDYRHAITGRHDKGDVAPAYAGSLIRRLDVAVPGQPLRDLVQRLRE